MFVSVQIILLANNGIDVCQRERPVAFAARYLCATDTVNYIGIDSVRVVTAVPEPSAFLMLGPGLTAFGLAPRKLSN